mmetsp:Transcript_73936/g.175967  ORF Transcript_73936/g.175967 Transcript_73936/m.175967 type:complete len:403 (-) Transcript_73936:183-1391(-)
MAASAAQPLNGNNGEVLSKPGGDAIVSAGKKKKKMPSLLSHAVTGTLGSILAEVMLFPIDTIKLRVQTSKESIGFLSMLFQILRQSGFMGLYAGLSGAIFKETVHSMNFWIFHGLIFKWATEHGDSAKTPAMRRLFLNLIAKQLNWLCTVPFEVVSSVNQLTPGSPGLITTGMNLYKTSGLGAFYRGLAVSLILAINPALMNTLVTTFVGFATTAKKALGYDSAAAKDHGPAATGLATGISKACATAITYPLIRAKVLQQTQMSGKDLTLKQVLIGTFVEEGAAGLYRGVFAMSYKTVVWNSLMMAFRHMLGAKPAVTPPGTPPPADEESEKVSVSFFAREPFPLELVTNEKLDEILSHLKLQQSAVDEQRVDSIESRLGEVSSEMKEVKNLLAQLAESVKK